MSQRVLPTICSGCRRRSSAARPAIMVKRSSSSCSQYQSEDRFTRLFRRASLARSARSASFFSVMSRPTPR